MNYNKKTLIDDAAKQKKTYLIIVVEQWTNETKRLMKISYKNILHFLIAFYKLVH